MWGLIRGALKLGGKMERVEGVRVTKNDDDGKGVRKKRARSPTKENAHGGGWG